MTATEEFQQELLEQFVSKAEQASATVELIAHEAGELKAALLRSIDGQAPVLMAKPEITDEEIFRPFFSTRNVVFHPSDSQLETAPIGITEAFAGIARTGSVCILVSENLSGSVSLFTRKHIAVLEATRIIARPRDLFESTDYNELGLTRDFIFVTGPSATADMGPLVHGVHGPGELHIIILDGEGGRN